MQREYVQELAGEEANIIFGAMYDDTKTDEATITVIATGLHNTGGTASKLKARLEKAVMPTIQNVEQPEVSVNQQAVNKELGAGSGKFSTTKGCGWNDADTAGAKNTNESCKRTVH